MTCKVASLFALQTEIQICDWRGFSTYLNYVLILFLEDSLGFELGILPSIESFFSMLARARLKFLERRQESYSDSTNSHLEPIDKVATHQRQAQRPI